jgi:replicative DNA helicase
MGETMRSGPVGGGRSIAEAGQAGMAQHIAAWGLSDDPVDVAEIGVLGAALLSDAARAGLLDLLDPSDFAREAHAVVWSAIAAEDAAGGPVDLVTSTDRLARCGQLDEIGGPAALSWLVDGLTCPSPSAWPAYGRIVLRGSRTRRVRAALARGVRRLDDGDDLEQVAGEVAAEVKPW